MRESMATLTPRFSANRAVGEYTEQHYLPAAAAYRARAAAKGAVGKNIVNWEHALKEKWGTLRLGEVKVQTNAAQHIFEAEVYLNGLDPKAVRVELYAEGINGSSPIREEMTRVRPLTGADSGHAYVAQVPATRPVTDYTARIIPHCEGVAIPLEDARIQWQR
jgi:starch phosphorylase